MSTFKMELTLTADAEVTHAEPEDNKEQE